MNPKKLSLLLGFSLASAACGGDNLTLPSEGEPAHIAIWDGNDQLGRVASPLPDSLVVKVTDSRDRPVPNASVEFVLIQDGGGATLAPGSARTDSEGLAGTKVTLGPQVGQITGQARVPVPEGTVPVVVDFVETAASDDASGISMVSGDGQIAPVNTALGAPLVVKVTDGFGNPIPNIPVDWTVTGGGSVSQSSTQTDGNGETFVTRTLGPTAGQQTTQASSDDLVGSPVTFTHTATAGSASSITKFSGDNQTGPTGTELPQPLVVEVLDEQGNPIANRPVSWVIGAGEGQVNPETSNTDGEGHASTRWTLGGSPGRNTVNAVVSGVGTVTFSATASGTGSPSNLAVTTQPPSSVPVGATLNPAPVVQVRDADGHDLAVAGVQITAGVSSGGGRLEGTLTVATDGNGRATFSNLRITGGTGSHRLIFAAEGYRSATSDKFDVEKASTTTSITDQSANPTSPGETFTVSFSVTSSAGTPTGEVEVKATDSNASESEKCSALVSQGSCQITLVNPGDRTLTATYDGEGIFAGSSGTAAHHVNEPVPPPNNPPTASFTHADCTAGTPCQFNDASTDPEGNSTIVEWTWDFGDFSGVSHEQNPAHNYIVGAEFPYSVTLTVKDNQDASNSTTQTVTVH